MTRKRTMRERAMAAPRVGYCAAVRGIARHLPTRRLRFWVAVYVLRALLIAPTPLAAEPAAQPENVRADEVVIEGKLYTPRALFIVSRNEEGFGRDAIVPHYLRMHPDPRFLPYRIRLQGSRDGWALPDSLDGVEPRRKP